VGASTADDGRPGAGRAGEPGPAPAPGEAAPDALKPQLHDAGGEVSMSVEETNRCAGGLVGLVEAMCTRGCVTQRRARALLVRARQDWPHVWLVCPDARVGVGRAEAWP